MAGQGLALSDIKIYNKVAVFKAVWHRNILKSRNRFTHGTVI